MSFTIDCLACRNRWEGVCQEVKERAELASVGKGHLGCYADCCVPFCLWLSAAERRLADLKPVPRSREGLHHHMQEAQVCV